MCTRFQVNEPTHKPQAYGAQAINLQKLASCTSGFKYIFRDTIAKRKFCIEVFCDRADHNIVYFLKGRFSGNMYVLLLMGRHRRGITHRSVCALWCTPERVANGLYKAQNPASNNCSCTAAKRQWLLASLERSFLSLVSFVTLLKSPFKGSSNGIGRAAARLFAREGADGVTITGRNKAALEAGLLVPFHFF